MFIKHDTLLAILFAYFSKGKDKMKPGREEDVELEESILIRCIVRSRDKHFDDITTTLVDADEYAIACI